MDFVGCRMCFILLLGNGIDINLFRRKGLCRDFLRSVLDL